MYALKVRVLVKIGYVCDTCGQFTESCGKENLLRWLDNITESRPWICPVCGKETCTHCYWKFGSHKECCQGKTDEELIIIADSKGFNFINK